MNPFVRAITALNRAQVQYVVVGGFAAYLHGTRRVTVDLDLVVDLTPQNALAAVDALLAAGLRSRLPVDPHLYADEAHRTGWVREKNMLVFTFFDPASPGFVVDLFVELPRPFTDLQSDACEIDLGGEPVRIASIDDLIAMKQAAGRAQDMLDIRMLQDIKTLRDRNAP